MQEVNERWLQFAFLNSKGHDNKTALKIPFHTSLEVDQEVPVDIAGHSYTFTCVAVKTKSTDSDKVDMVYVVATNNQ